MTGRTKIYTQPAAQTARLQNRNASRWRGRAIALLFLGGSLAAGLGGCNFAEVDASPAETSAAALPQEIPPAPAPVPRSTPLSRAATTDESTLLPQTSPGQQRGPFRVGNQTQHPIRLALQTRLDPKRFDPETQSAINPEGLDLEPVHWDFAPGEGGQSGLLMSLPQGDIELRNGDVLVAFAQDGSSRYWGPYIVGETQLPYWDEQRQEWQLLVQP